MTTQSELITRLKRDFAAQSSDLTDDNYDDAVDDAEIELGWTLPQTDSFRITWLRKRSTRHLLYYLIQQSARKFRVEQYHLHQRFAHYFKLIDMQDDEFRIALEDKAHLFDSVNASQMFGFNIHAGFQYNKIGEDTTYDVDNQVIVDPLKET